jgi:hypothetical protein
MTKRARLGVHPGRAHRHEGVDMSSSYYEAIEREQAILDRALASIRERQDSGELTPREAADRRIAAMEASLAAIRVLRDAEFGRAE